MCFYSARISPASARSRQTTLHHLSVVRGLTTQVFILYLGRRANWVSSYEKFSYSGMSLFPQISLNGIYGV